MRLYTLEATETENHYCASANDPVMEREVLTHHLYHTAQSVSLVNIACIVNLFDKTQTNSFTSRMKEHENDEMNPEAKNV